MKLNRLRVQRYNREMLQWQEEERKRVAGELHDGVGQHLVMIKNKLQKIRSGEVADDLFKLENAVADTIQEVRTVSYSLRPFYLNILGLEGAIAELGREIAKSTELTVNSDLEGLDGQFSKEEEIHVFRIFQE